MLARNKEQILLFGSVGIVFFQFSFSETSRHLNYKGDRNILALHYYRYNPIISFIKLNYL